MKSGFVIFAFFRDFRDPSVLCWVVGAGYIASPIERASRRSGIETPVNISASGSAWTPKQVLWKRQTQKRLDGFGVTEENWRDAIPKHPGFERSETPFYIGREVVALARDPNVMEKTGHALSAGYLARDYGFTDGDGRQPPGYARDDVDIREGVFKDGRFISFHQELGGGHP